MQITSSVLFYRLSLDYHTASQVASKTCIALNSVRIGTSNVVKGAVHIVSGEIGDIAKKNQDSAFVVLSSPPVLDFDANVAYVYTAVPQDELVNSVLRIFNELQDWDCRLMEACLDGRDFDHFFAIARETLNYSYAVLDREMKNIARTQDYLGKFKYYQPDPDQVADSAAQEFFLDKEFQNSLKRKDVFLFPENQCTESQGSEGKGPEGKNHDKFICFNIAEDSRNIARFQAILDNHNVSQGEFQLFHHISKYAEKLYLSIINGKYRNRQSNAQHQLLYLLLFQNEHMSRHSASRILAASGWSFEDTYSVSTIRFINKSDFSLRLLYLCRKLEEALPMSCVVHDGASIVWVINHSRSRDFDFSEFASVFRDLLCEIGTSDRFSDFSEIGIYSKQSATALEIGSARDSHLWHFAFDNYKFDYLLLHATKEFSARQVVHSGLTKLMEYDKQSGMNYADTLRKYLANHFNASVSASELFLHRSTFLRRLERIEQISGINLRDPDDIVYLMLSLRLLKEDKANETDK